ncbi:MAG: TonB family protein [Saprospiraceae bacterium]|nr:TonB family protein [Saprospiraceae bacterium]
MFEYAILVTLYWAAFYALYALLLRRHTFFQLNRLYLLGALAAGMLLPSLKDISLLRTTQEDPVLYVAPVVEGFEFIYNLEAIVIAPAPAAFPWKAVLAAVYLLGAGFCLLRLFAGLYRLRRLQAGSELAYIGGSRVAYTATAHLPFSFGRTIYMSRQTRWTPEEEADIIRHEQAHIRDGHTMDVLALELLGVIFWFSPPLHLYRRSLRLLHEYIADAIVLRSRARSVYGRLLIRQALPGLQPYMAHSFHSSLKQRISMMTKTQSNPVARWLYLAAAPLAFGLVLLFSQRSAIAASMPELPSLLPFATEEGKNTPAEAPGTIAVAAPVISGGDSDVMPVFAGCETEAVEARKTCSDKKMLEFVYHQLRYPEKAREAGITGTVVARFTVSATGEVTGLETLKDIGGGCGEEVLRVLREMPRWTPGKKEGKPVAVTLTLPVRFALPTEESIISDHSMVFDSERKELKTSVDGVVNILGVEAKELTLADEAQQDDKPLFYINGKRVSESAVNIDLNPNQIKSIDVLKGEKAIVFAGEEGKNGVILITLYADGEKRPATSGTPPAANNGEEIFKVVEEMPRFPGCEDAEDLSLEAKKNCADKKMLEFVYNNIRYPAQARESAIEGTVVVSFIVETDGTITEPKVARDIGGGCGEEVLRVVRLMPGWVPGKQRGRLVRTQFNLPVRYKLDSGQAPAAPPADKQTLKLEDFKLFPNPTDGKFTLQFNAPAKPTLIQVRDMQGREVFTRNLNSFSGAFREELSLGKAPKGDYVVVISQGHLVYTSNLVRL